MKYSDKLKPGWRDLLVVAVVLALAGLCFAGFTLKGSSDALVAVVSIEGTEVERFALAPRADQQYQNRGCCLTLHYSPEQQGLQVTEADCPGQDCVRTGVITRAGQSIVCLPGRIMITLQGADDSYDLIAG